MPVFSMILMKTNVLAALLTIFQYCVGSIKITPSWTEFLRLLFKDCGLKTRVAKMTVIYRYKHSLEGDITRLPRLVTY